MWFEVLPSAVIMTVALAIPQFFPAALNSVIFGNMFRRSHSGQDRSLQYLRDARLTGNPYKVQGIEAIPDE